MFFFSTKRKKASKHQLHTTNPKHELNGQLILFGFLRCVDVCFAKMSCVDEKTPWSQETQKLKFLVARSDARISSAESRIPCCWSMSKATTGPFFFPFPAIECNSYCPCRG